MSNIQFPNKHEYLFDCDVIEFPAVVDEKEILCRITLEEFIREHGSTSPKTFEQRFLELRPQVEERARQTIKEKAEYE